MKPNYPEEYIEGEVEFFYKKFFINEHVLIPRLETESLVRAGIDIIKKNSVDTLIDIGTGSGIIPVSIASIATLPYVSAVDISKDALEVAKKNAHSHNVDIDFFHGSLLEVFLKEKQQIGNNILITANLPYVREGDEIGEGVEHEPALALYGGKETGFELYEEFLLQLQQFSRMYPVTIRAILEIGDGQREVATMVLEGLGFEYEFLHDLSAIDRFILIRFVWSSRSII